MASNHKPQPRNPQAKRAIDPLLQQRLLDLGSRRPGASLPPPEATARPGVPNRPAATVRAATGTGAARPGKRVKPARASKAASLALSVVTTAGLAAMFAGQDTPTESVVLTSGTSATTATPGTTATPVTTGSTAGTGATGATPGTTATTATTQAPAGTGAIIDGTYVGGGSRNRWGTVQVQAVYSGGQLVDVQILQYPNGDRKSLAISQRVLPTLIDRAISVQSAAVDNISGATYTSRSYIQSLQSAIDAAKAASGIA